MNMENVKTQELKDELENRGYAVGCLWRADDVWNYDESGTMTEDEAVEIMNGVLRSDWLTEQIFSLIQDAVSAYKNDKQ